MKHQFIVMIRERIGNEYFINEYSGIAHWNKDDAMRELTEARNETANDIYTDCFIREVGI